MNARRWALFGAEDFGLFFTAPAQQSKTIERLVTKSGTTLTWIGEVRAADQGVKLHNLEKEEVELANRSWNALVRKKTS